MNLAGIGDRCYNHFIRERRSVEQAVRKENEIMIGAPVSIQCRRNNKIYIRALPGHFAMTHSHTNYYIDIMESKLNQQMAGEAAQTLAQSFTYEQQIDTIVCMDGSEIIGAFLAHELAKGNIYSVNGKKDIYVVTPERENARQMIFRDNIQPMIRDKKVLILCGSVLTGKNVRKAIQCVKWYGGEVVGIASVFSIVDEIDNLKVNHLYCKADFPEYDACDYTECKLCQAGQPIDALANCYGYSKL